MSGSVYLVQPVELIGTNRYKIGCSSKNDLSRCLNGYNKGTRYITILECPEPFKVESQIIRVFKDKFKLIGGREYFEGDETEMRTKFIEIVDSYKLNENPIEMPIIENPEQEDKPQNIDTDTLVCKACSRTYCSYASFKRHIVQGRCKGKLQNTLNSSIDISDTSSEISESERVTCMSCNKPFANKYSLQRHNMGACKSSRLKKLLTNPANIAVLENALELVKSGNQTINNGNLTNNYGNLTNNNNTNHGTINNNIDNKTINNTLNQTANNTNNLFLY